MRAGAACLPTGMVRASVQHPAVYKILSNARTELIFCFLSYAMLSVCLLTNLVITKHELRHSDDGALAYQLGVCPLLLLHRLQSFCWSDLYKLQLTWRGRGLSRPMSNNPSHADKETVTKKPYSKQRRLEQWKASAVSTQLNKQKLYIKPVGIYHNRSACEPKLKGLCPAFWLIQATLRDFRLSPPCNEGLYSFGILRSVEW
jgi:hypothetical protein